MRDSPSDQPNGKLVRNGFVVLRGQIDVEALSQEFDRLLGDAFVRSQAARQLREGTGTVTFQYAPMMCERTPYSLILLDHFAVIAADLMGRAVLPGRAKGTWYEGNTGWHRDSLADITSIGMVAYLDPLRADSGALRVVPGSHARPDQSLPRPGDDVGIAIATTPGDVIAFDEHLIHGSTGGSVRRQWRVDFVIDPQDATEERRVRAWFAQSVPSDGSDPGYDVELYPSYGSHWQGRDRPWTERLRALGVYDLAAR